MRIFLFIIPFFVIIQTNAQSEYSSSHLIQDETYSDSKIDNIDVQKLAKGFRENAISSSVFLQALEENPLTIKKYAETLSEKNNLAIVTGVISSIEITGSDNSICEVQFKNDVWYEMSMYMPIQKDFYDLKNGDSFYAIVNIGDISKYEIICDVALGAQTAEGLASKLFDLANALKEGDMDVLKYFLDVEMYYLDISFEKSLSSFRNLLMNNM